MQMFFKNSPLNDKMMLRTYEEQLNALIGDDNGMLNVDGSDFPLIFNYFGRVLEKPFFFTVNHDGIFAA